MAIGHRPGVRGPTAQEVTAAASIAVVGLAVFLTWKVNTTEADPSHLTCLLAADYVAVGASLLAAAIWSGFLPSGLVAAVAQGPVLANIHRRRCSLYLLIGVVGTFRVPRKWMLLAASISLFRGLRRRVSSSPPIRSTWSRSFMLIWVAVMNGDDVKMQFDGLSYDPSRRADWVGTVRDYHDWGNNGMDFRQHPPWKDPAPEGPQAEPGCATRGWPGGPPELHNDEAVLNNWRAASGGGPARAEQRGRAPSDVPPQTRGRLRDRRREPGAGADLDGPAARPARSRDAGGRG